jgi:hypothetical protein
MKPLLSLYLLLLYAPAFSADESPPVFISHFYTSLDQATYDTLRKSPEIAALARTEERHTVAGTRNWSGFYIYGRQTYMEFFAADTLADGQSKDCGLGLSVEKAGGVEALATLLRPVFADKVKIEKQVRTISTGDIAGTARQRSIPKSSPRVRGRGYNRLLCACDVPFVSERLN